MTEIENLDELTELTELYISENGITSIKGLENNLKLETIDLAKNQIKKIENVGHLTELEEFWVSHFFTGVVLGLISGNCEKM